MHSDAAASRNLMLMQLWEKDPEATDMALKLHDDIFRRYLSAYYGFELATEGGEPAELLMLSQDTDAHG